MFPMEKVLKKKRNQYIFTENFSVSSDFYLVCTNNRGKKLGNPEKMYAVTSKIQERKMAISIEPNKK